MNSSQVFFPTFNARHLVAEQVASSFVPNSKFRQLASPQNALLIGPRGSGKTHLLKMLQPKALACWEHSEAEQTRSNLGFAGVFIPADEAWRQQLTCIATQIEEPLSQRFTDSIFSAHFQKALLDTFLQLTYDRPHKDNGFLFIQLPRNLEVEMCRLLAHSWGLKPKILSFVGLKLAIVDRTSLLQEAARSNTQRLVQLLEDSQTDVVACATQGIEAFNGITQKYQTRWGLLFDELEIAPATVQRKLFSCLRSTDQRIVFKLAISPSASAANVFRDAYGPTPGNDFEEISLYADSRDANIFCETLWGYLASSIDASGTTSNPVGILGHSVFHVPDTRETYSRRGSWQRAFAELSQKDSSFASLLTRKGVDPFALDKATPAIKDSVVRKVAPLVGFRNLLIEKGPSRPGEKSILRKGKLSHARIYSGWEALCLISEANPRWFTGIARQLLIERSRGRTGRDITIEQQYRIIKGASQKFLDYVSTIPSKLLAPGDSGKGGLRYLVDELAKAFRSGVLEEPFALDPVLSFDVPQACDDAMLEAIVDGLYSGAFIPVGALEGRSIFSQIQGSRLRLTFLLAPLELLPLRSGKERLLTNIVREHPRLAKHEFDVDKKALRRDDTAQQPRLFDE